MSQVERRGDRWMLSPAQHRSACPTAAYFRACRVAEAVYASRMFGRSCGCPVSSSAGSVLQDEEHLPLIRTAQALDAATRQTFQFASRRTEAKELSVHWQGPDDYLILTIANPFLAGPIKYFPLYLPELPAGSRRFRFI